MPFYVPLKNESLKAYSHTDQSTEKVETTAKTASSRKVSKEPTPSKDEEEDKVPAEE